MRRVIHAVPILLLIILSALPAPAQALKLATRPLFEANNVIIGRPGMLEAYAPDFSVLNDHIVLAGGQPTPGFEPHPGFMPLANGNWLVGTNEQDTNGQAVTFLREYDSAGNVVRTGGLANFGVLRHLAPAPSGRFFAVMSGGVLEMVATPLSFGIVRLLTIVQNPVGAAMLPDGTIALINAQEVKRVTYSPNIVLNERTLSTDPTDLLTGLTATAEGTLIITATSRIYRLSTELVPIDEMNLAGAVGPSCLPNHQLLVVLPAINALAEVNLTTKTATTITLSGEGTISAFAVVPHRFAVSLDGVLAVGSALTNTTASATVSWQPGSGRAVMVLDPASASLATTLGQDTVVLEGFEADDAGVKGERLLQGAQRQDVSSSLGADVTGAAGANAFYFADKLEGSVRAAGDGALLDAALKSAILLNP